MHCACWFRFERMSRPAFSARLSSACSSAYGSRTDVVGGPPKADVVSAVLGRKQGLRSAGTRFHPSPPFGRSACRTEVGATPNVGFLAETSRRLATQSGLWSLGSGLANERRPARMRRMQAFIYLLAALLLVCSAVQGLATVLSLTTGSLRWRALSAAKSRKVTRGGDPTLYWCGVGIGFLTATIYGGTAAYLFQKTTFS